jgi:hypothetical protein
MLIEQAFFSLPEVLHGSGYLQQDYEAGVVAAFSMSLLQVLNGRNVPNPISCLQSEKMFRARGDFRGAAGPRYFRTDLFMNIGSMTVGNKRLAQYGWRHNAWLEGKFFRRPSTPPETHSTAKTQTVAGIMADLIRLAVFVPERIDRPSRAGRYMLHVYDQPPEYYLTHQKRAWTKKLCTEGSQDVVIAGLGAEGASFRRMLGDMPDLQLTLKVTNFVAKPIHTEHYPVYWCHLSRIDAVLARVGEHSFELKADRNILVSSPDALDRIAAYVADRLHIAADSVETQPAPEVEPDEDNLQAGEAAAPEVPAAP